MVTVTDALILPDGTPMKCAKLKLVAHSTGESLQGSAITIYTEDTGIVNFTLVNGVYKLSLIPNKEVASLEVLIEITETTPSPITVVDLVNNHKYVE